MRVDKRDFESFLNSHALVKREQELQELLRVEKREFYESFLNSHVLAKREQELLESWWELTHQKFVRTPINMIVDKQEFVRVFSSLMSWSNDNKSCTRIDESWQARVCMKVSHRLCSDEAPDE